MKQRSVKVSHINWIELKCCQLMLSDIKLAPLLFDELGDDLENVTTTKH